MASGGSLWVQCQDLHVCGVVGRCVPSVAGFWAHPPSLCMSVQHAAQMEQKQNDTENKKVHGDVVKYGSVIQV